MIIVEYNSDVLGKGEFWRGPENEIADIRNVVARELAQQVVASDGLFTFQKGMWTVRQIDDDNEQQNARFARAWEVEIEV